MEPKDAVKFLRKIRPEKLIAMTLCKSVLCAVMVRPDEWESGDCSSPDADVRILLPHRSMNVSTLVSAPHGYVPVAVVQYILTGPGQIGRKVGHLHGDPNLRTYVEEVTFEALANGWVISHLFAM